MEERIEINSTTIKAILYHLIDYIIFYERMERTHNCNDCARQKDCDIVPDYGQQVRYNCYKWSVDTKGAK